MNIHCRKKGNKNKNKATIISFFFRNNVREMNYFSWRNMKQATAQKQICVDDWRSKAYRYWGGKLASQK